MYPVGTRRRRPARPVRCRTHRDGPSPQASGDRGRQAISQRWGHLHRQTPAFGLRMPQMHGPAARTRRLPVRRLLGGHRHDGPACRVAHVLERQRRAGLAPASVAAQAPRSPVAVEGLLAGRAGRLPVAGLHDGLVRGLAGRGVAPSRTATAFQPGPCLAAGPAMAWAISCRSVSRTDSGGAVPGVVLGDLDPLRPVLAHAQPTLRVRQAEGPAVQAVLRQFPGGRSLPVPSGPSPALRQPSIDRRTRPIQDLARARSPGPRPRGSPARSARRRPAARCTTAATVSPSKIANGL